MASNSVRYRERDRYLFFKCMSYYLVRIRKLACTHRKKITFLGLQGLCTIIVRPAIRSQFAVHVWYICGIFYVKHLILNVKNRMNFISSLTPFMRGTIWHKWIHLTGLALEKVIISFVAELGWLAFLHFHSRLFPHRSRNSRKNLSYRWVSLGCAAKGVLKWGEVKCICMLKQGTEVAQMSSNKLV